MANKFDFAGMSDDEQARKDMAAWYANAKKRAEELKDAHRAGGAPNLEIPDKLMDDVVQGMFGAKPEGGPALQVEFIEGPFDGMVEAMNATPEVLAMRVGPPQVQIVGRNVAVSIFYDVAVYALQKRGDRLVYQFEGYSECMEGLG